jgi:hypothetical protein
VTPPNKQLMGRILFEIIPIFFAVLFALMVSAAFGLI